MGEECKHKYQISIHAKCDDRVYLQLNYRGFQIAEDDYLPRELKLGSCGYLQITFCIECNKIVSPANLKENVEHYIEEKRCQEEVDLDAEWDGEPVGDFY